MKKKNFFLEHKQFTVFFILALLIVGVAVFAPWIAPKDPLDAVMLDSLKAPCQEYPLGTDKLGRDMLSRVIFGTRTSLVYTLILVATIFVVGTVLGIVAGYFGGWIDQVIMRIADIMLSIPSLLLAMVIMYTLGSSTINLFLALSMINWASVARVVRSQTLSLKESEYVEAARSIGVSRWKIMMRHILPNCIPSLIVLFTLEVPSSILSESSLSFLGIGVQPPAASWGLMVNQAKQFLFTQPWLCLAPCLSIMVVVLAFNFLGDGLRDVLDPYMKNS